ncbi:MAG TPA: hypothetical protein VNM16_12155 [Bacillota bacterium]|nr:hypothetical protein [Bacillota bacterium]
MTRRLLHLFWPLAASSLLMATAEALVSAGLARVPGPEVALAAFGAVLAVSLLIEAPVIPLLHAANALGGDAASRRLVFRFMLVVAAACGLLHAAVALTPLYAVVFGRWLGLPPLVVAAGRAGMACMIPWSPAIAWRRYYQGILIRRGATRPVGIGTITRTVTAGIILVTGLTLWPQVGVAIGGLALALGVSAEAVFITFAARLLGPPPDRAEPPRPLDLRRLLGFYVPLALTSAVSFLGRSVAAAELARGALPVASLAAWPVAYAALFLIQGPVAMTQQLVIAGPEGVDARTLRRFTLGVGAVATAVVIALLPGGLGLYFSAVIGVHGTVLSLALDALAVLAVLPLLTAMQQYWQGLLVRARATWVVIGGSSANLVALTAVGFFAVTRLPWPGVDTVAAATLVGFGAELAVLALAKGRALRAGAAAGALLEAEAEIGA